MGERRRSEQKYTTLYIAMKNAVSNVLNHTTSNVHKAAWVL